MFSYGRCYCHSFCGRCLLPLLCILLADVVAIFLLADVIAIVKHKKIMQEVWGTCALQGRTYHQKPPNGSQGQRSYPEEKWSHIQI